MKKSAYSLILADEVVQAIDELAAREGTNRSGLINEILADYLSLTTPEKRIDGVFRAVEEAFREFADLPVLYESRSPVLTVKSALAYRYRPTMRYEVELYRVPDDYIGKLSVSYRTQSPELVEELNGFFELWKKLEQLYTAQTLVSAPVYRVEAGKWERTLSTPRYGNGAAKDLSKRISDYVRSFDRTLKKWLSGGYASARELEREFISLAEDYNLLI